MNCPVCSGVQLLIADRQGVEIDYCPQCRGIWLDRGELDKLIERSYSVAGASPQPEQPGYQPGYRQHHEKSHDDHRYGHGSQHRKSWLSELFD